MRFPGAAGAYTPQPRVNGKKHKHTEWVPERLISMERADALEIDLSLRFDRCEELLASMKGDHAD